MRIQQTSEAGTEKTGPAARVVAMRKKGEFGHLEASRPKKDGVLLLFGAVIKQHAPNRLIEEFILACFLRD